MTLLSNLDPSVAAIKSTQLTWVLQVQSRSFRSKLLPNFLRQVTSKVLAPSHDLDRVNVCF